MTSPPGGKHAIIQISLCMICKNEANLLEGCLESAAELVDEIIIVDTGSDDGSPEIAERLGARVIIRDWVDFSTARNQSLAAAGGDWIFFLDADEEVACPDPNLLRQLASSNQADAFSIRVINCMEMSEFVDVDKSPQMFNTRFFRSAGAKFVNPIHEIIVLPEGARTIPVTGIDIIHYGYLKQIYNEREKTDRNESLLRDWLASDADNPWPHFYLGNQLHRSKNYAEAADHYEHAIPGLVDERVSAAGADAHKTLADCYSHLQQPERIGPILDRALALYPDYVELYYFYAQYMFESDRAADAIPWLGKCLEIPEENPDYNMTTRGAGSWRAFEGLATAWHKLGQNDKSVVAQAAAWRFGEDRETPAALFFFLSTEAQELIADIDQNGTRAIDRVRAFLTQDG